MSNYYWFQFRFIFKIFYFCPTPFAKAGHIKTHSSVCPSLCLSVRYKNFNLAHIFLSINDRALIFGMHDPCDKPFQLAPCSDLDLDTELRQGQSCCKAGDHNSPNLLVYIYTYFIGPSPCGKSLNVRENVQRHAPIVSTDNCYEIHSWRMWLVNEKTGSLRANLLPRVYECTNKTFKLYSFQTAKFGIPVFQGHVYYYNDMFLKSRMGTSVLETNVLSTGLTFIG